MFKTGEIKLTANDNTYKCVTTQNTDACAHAFKWSLGYRNRTLLSYSYFFPISFHNLRNERTEERHVVMVCHRKGPGKHMA